MPQTMKEDSNESGPSTKKVPTGRDSDQSFLQRLKELDVPRAKNPDKETGKNANGTDDAPTAGTTASDFYTFRFGGVVISCRGFPEAEGLFEGFPGCSGKLSLNVSTGKDPETVSLEVSGGKKTNISLLKNHPLLRKADHKPETVSLDLPDTMELGSIPLDVFDSLEKMISTSLGDMIITQRANVSGEAIAVCEALQYFSSVFDFYAIDARVIRVVLTHAAEMESQSMQVSDKWAHFCNVAMFAAILLAHDFPSVKVPTDIAGYLQTHVACVTVVKTLSTFEKYMAFSSNLSDFTKIPEQNYSPKDMHMVVIPMTPAEIVAAAIAALNIETPGQGSQEQQKALVLPLSRIVGGKVGTHTPIATGIVDAKLGLTFSPIAATKKPSATATAKIGAAKKNEGETGKKPEDDKKSKPKLNVAYEINVGFFKQCKDGTEIGQTIKATFQNGAHVYLADMATATGYHCAGIVGGVAEKTYLPQNAPTNVSQADSQRARDTLKRVFAKDFKYPHIRNMFVIKCPRFKWVNMAEEDSGKEIVAVNSLAKALNSVIPYIEQNAPSTGAGLESFYKGLAFWANSNSKNQMIVEVVGMVAGVASEAVLTRISSTAVRIGYSAEKKKPVLGNEYCRSRRTILAGFKDFDIFCSEESRSSRLGKNQKYTVMTAGLEAYKIAATPKRTEKDKAARAEKGDKTSEHQFIADLITGAFMNSLKLLQGTEFVPLYDLADVPNALPGAVASKQTHRSEMALAFATALGGGSILSTDFTEGQLSYFFETLCPNLKMPIMARVVGTKGKNTPLVI